MKNNKEFGILHFLKTYYPYMKKHKLYFFFTAIAILLSSGGASATAYLMKPVLDEIFINKDTNMLLTLPLLLVLAYFSKGMGAYVQAYCMSYIGLDIVRQIRIKMLDHLLSLELSFFNKKSTGELIGRITGDIAQIRSAVSNYFTEFVREILTIIGLGSVVIIQNYKLAILGLLIMPLSAIPIIIIVRFIKKISRQIQESNADLTSRLSEIFNNVEIVKASNGEKMESKAFYNEDMRYFKLTMKSTLISGITSPLMETLGAIAMGVVIYIGGQDVIEGKMSAGEFVSFLTAMLLIYTPIKRVLGSYAGIQIALVAAERIDSIMRLKPAIVDGEKILEEDISSIKVQDVSMKYDDELVLKNVNACFNKNTITAIVGKSGSGKSSLVNLILRLYDPFKGNILVNDLCIKNFTQKSLRENISIVTQRIFIFNDTIANNVAYGFKQDNKQVDEARVIDALKKACVYDFVQNLEYGIHTLLDEFGANLSGGQRQRIAIARAIYKDSKVLILDEATSALDEKTEIAIKDTLQKIRNDKIIIIIAHRPSTIALADNIISISNGVIEHNLTQEQYQTKLLHDVKFLKEHDIK